jgi:hypothetical protein
VPGEPGKWLIPNQNAPGTPNVFSPYNAFLPGTATLHIRSGGCRSRLEHRRQGHCLAVKYYYQHDPNTSPYAYSNVPGFTAHMDTGSQVGSLNNAQTIGNSLSISETVAIPAREGLCTNDQLSPREQSRHELGFGNYFPGITINDAIGDARTSEVLVAPARPAVWPGTFPSLAIGPDAASQGANTGIFQNRIMPSGTAVWAKGRHSVSFGGSWSYTQLNTQRSIALARAIVATPDFVTFANNWVTPY